MSKYNLHDIVYCRSGDGKGWIGYIKTTFMNDEIIIRWYNNDNRQWHETVRFAPEPSDKNFAVLGPMPEGVEFDVANA